MITGMVQDIYEGIKTIENSRAFGSCQNHFSTCSFKKPALQGTCQGRPLQRGFFKQARREKILTRAERLRHFGHFGAFWLMGIAIQVRNGRQKVRSWGYYKNFFVLGVIANLRPLYYTKCPPNRIEKWSQICCISKHNKVKILAGSLGSLFRILEQGILMHMRL